MSARPLRHRLRRGLDALVVLAFASAIAAPTVDAFVRDEEARGPGPEMRKAAPMPEFPGRVDNLSTFPAAFDAHFSDTFGLRDRLLKLHSMSLYYLFGTSPTRQIVAGKDGWIFWAGDRSDEVFRGVVPFSADELAGWQYELEARTHALERIGCHYLFVIAPNKETIYPERMPVSQSRLGPTRLEQFVQWMKEHSQVDVLDLRPALLAAKAQDKGPRDAVCTPFGTHWTGRGTVAAASAVVDHLARTHPGAKPFDPRDVDMNPLQAASDSLAGDMYMSDLLQTPDTSPTPHEPRGFETVERHEEVPAEIVTRARARDVLPPTVMFHDSFGPFLQPLLAANCETLETHSMHFDAKQVDAKRTKIVVELYVERVFVTWVPDTVAPPDMVDAVKRFEALPNVLFDMAQAPDAGAPVSGMPVERVQVDGRPALRLTQRGARQGFEFEGIRLPTIGTVLLRIEAESPEPGLLDVAWRRSGTPTYKRRDRTTIPLEAGRSERVLTLPALGTDCVLLLRPRQSGLTVTVRTFSVRASD